MTLDEIRHAIKSRRAFWIFVSYLMLMFFLGYNFIRVKLEIQRRMDIQGVSRYYGRFLPGLATQVLQDTTDLADYFLEIPIMVMLFFLASLFLMPLFITLMSFDTVSGEIHEGSLRFLLPRAGRSAIFCGKFFASLIICTGTTCIVTFVFFALTLVLDIEKDPSNVAKFAWRFAYILFCYSAYFSGIVLMFSGMFRKPTASLFGCFGYLLFIPLFSTIIAHLMENVADSMAMMDLLDQLLHVSPHVFLRYLFYPPGQELLTGCAAYTVHGIIHACIGYMLFAHR